METYDPDTREKLTTMGDMVDDIDNGTAGLGTIIPLGIGTVVWAFIAMFLAGATIEYVFEHAPQVFTWCVLLSIASVLGYCALIFAIYVIIKVGRRITGG